MCPGNGGNISHRVPIIQGLTRPGLGVFIFDYRGYGLSQGRAGEVASIRMLRPLTNICVDSLGVPPERIVLWGVLWEG